MLGRMRFMVTSIKNQVYLSKGELDLFAQKLSNLGHGIQGD